MLVTLLIEKNIIILFNEKCINFLNRWLKIKIIHSTQHTNQTTSEKMLNQKDTCCTVRCITVSGDWDSLSN